MAGQPGIGWSPGVVKGARRRGEEDSSHTDERLVIHMGTDHVSV